MQFCFFNVKFEENNDEIDLLHVLSNKFSSVKKPLKSSLHFEDPLYTQYNVFNEPMFMLIHMRSLTRILSLWHVIAHKLRYMNDFLRKV